MHKFMHMLCNNIYRDSSPKYISVIINPLVISNLNIGNRATAVTINLHWFRVQTVEVNGYGR